MAGHQYYISYQQNKKLDEAEARLQEIDQRIKSLGPAYDEVTDLMARQKELRKRLELIAKANRKRIDKNTALMKSFVILPPQLSLTEFELKRNQVHFIGYGFNDSPIMKFVKILEENIYFEKVQLEFIKKSTVEGKLQSKFKISTQLVTQQRTAK